MANPIGNGYIGSCQCQIIAKHLVEHFLGKCHSRRFTFDQQPRITAPVENHDIETPFQAIQFNFSFDGNPGDRLSFLFYQIMHHMLPYPFFRCQDHILLPDDIEYHHRPVLLFHLIIESR